MASGIAIGESGRTVILLCRTILAVISLNKRIADFPFSHHVFPLIHPIKAIHTDAIRSAVLLGDLFPINAPGDSLTHSFFTDRRQLIAESEITADNGNTYDAVVTLTK